MKIRNKLAFTVVILAVLPLSFTFLVTIPTTQNAHTQEILSHLTSVASIHESRVEELIGDYHQEISHLTQHRIPTYIDAYLDNSSIDMQALAYEDIIEVKNINSLIRQIDIANSSGTVLASTNVTKVGYNLSGEEYFTRGLIGHVVDAFYLDMNNSLKVHLAGPVIINGSVGAVLVIDYNPCDIITLFQDYTGLGDSGEAFFAKRDENGDALFVTPIRHITQASLNLTLSKDDLSAPITQALLGIEATFTEAYDYRGYHVLAVTRYMPELDWGIVVKIDAAEAYAAMYQSITTHLVTSIISTLIILVVGFVITRLITTPISTLIKAATKISDGELSERADITSGDEMEMLAKSVNKMANTLVNLNIDLEKRVEERTKELTRSNEALEQFAYVISHDLQEPLRMIVSYLQLIEDRYKDHLDADGIEFINYAVDGSKRMREMVIDLLQFSRAGRQSLSEEEVDCNEIVEEVLANLKLSIQESGASVDTGQLPSIMANRGGITLVFQNLISNAIKFRSEKPPKIVIEAVEGGDKWKFSVADNGIGISGEHHNRIFDVFQKLHPRTEYSGTGIGLSVCKRVVEGLGGSICVESILNEGSTFFFTIPKERIIK
ncbi:MAG: sensor histidine kinase [Candidatus Thorarchaeota archaeon]